MQGTCLVGWECAEITPHQPVYIAGQFHERVSEKVANPITATILAVESVNAGQAGCFMWISCDLVCIRETFGQTVRDAIKKRIPELDASQIILNATHTHTAPDTAVAADGAPLGKHIADEFSLTVMPPEAYITFAAERIAEAAQRAWASREPSGIGYGLGHAVVGYNRRVSFLDGSCCMYADTNNPDFSHIEGHEDHGVNVLATWNARGTLTGVVVNLACPSQATENLFELSADFWHEARVELRRRIHPDLYVLAQCSAAGDQSPHVLINKKAEERMFRLQGRTERQDIGVRIADAVTSVLPAIEKEIDWAPVVSHACREISLPMRRLTEGDVADAVKEAEPLRAEYEHLRAELKSHPEKLREPRWYVPITSAYRRMRWNEGVSERFANQHANPTRDIMVHALRFGDVAFATSPFEYYLDFGQRIKARSRAVQTFVVQLVGPGTYLPTERAVAGKSYGAVAASTPIGPAGGQEVVEALLSMMESTFNAEKGEV